MDYQKILKVLTKHKTNVKVGCQQPEIHKELINYIISIGIMKKNSSIINKINLKSIQNIFYWKTRDLLHAKTRPIGLLCLHLKPHLQNLQMELLQTM